MIYDMLDGTKHTSVHKYIIEVCTALNRVNCVHADADICWLKWIYRLDCGEWRYRRIARSVWLVCTRQC